MDQERACPPFMAPLGEDALAQEREAWRRYAHGAEALAPVAMNPAPDCIRRAATLEEVWAIVKVPRQSHIETAEELLAKFDVFHKE